MSRVVTHSSKKAGKHASKPTKAVKVTSTAKLALTLHAWAIQAGKDNRTLEKEFMRSGIDVKAGRTYSLREFLTAQLSDEHVAKVRNLEADADRKEREEQEARRELVKFSEFEQQWSEKQALPLRQFLQSLPTTYDARCNSLDPAAARVALVQLRDDVLRLLRDNLGNLKGNGE